MNNIVAPSGQPTDLEATDQDLHAVEARAALKREQLKNTVDELEDKVVDSVGVVADTVDRTQDALKKVDQTVRKYRWGFIAGAVVSGAVIARSQARRPAPPTLPQPKQGLAAGLLSIAVSTAAKSVATQIARSVVEQRRPEAPPEEST